MIGSKPKALRELCKYKLQSNSLVDIDFALHIARSLNDEDFEEECLRECYTNAMEREDVVLAFVYATCLEDEGLKDDVCKKMDDLGDKISPARKDPLAICKVYQTRSTIEALADIKEVQRYHHFAQKHGITTYVEWVENRFSSKLPEN
jgi:hypothetical protein